MDERTRKIYDQAYATLDRLADFEPTPRNPTEPDALLTWTAGMPERSQSEPQPQELVRKTYMPPQQQQQRVDTAAAWNKWFSESFRNHIGKYNEALVEDITQAMGEVISTIRRELRKEFNEALGQVRADLTITNAVQRGEIAEIKKGVRDVA